MNGLESDVRTALRQLIRHRAISLFSVTILAVGFCAASIAGAVANGALLHPIAGAHPELLVQVGESFVRPDGKLSHPALSLQDARRWEQSRDLLAAAALYHSASRVLLADSSTQRIKTLEVSEDFLSVHGAIPLVGRDLVPMDTRADTPAVALVNAGFWKSRFAADPTVIGQTVHLDDQPVTIVGISPEDLAPATPLIVALKDTTNGPKHFEEIVGRLQSMVTPSAAANGLSAREPRDASAAAGPVRVTVDSIVAAEAESARPIVLMLVGAAAVILLLASINVAGVVLARGSQRYGELAVRTALGASRARLIRQLVIESSTVTCVGCLFGTVGAWWVGATIIAALPLTLSNETAMSMTPAVFAIVAACLVPVTVIVALVPSIRLSRSGRALGPALAHIRRQGPSLSRRTGQVIIAIEVALAVILVAGGGLALRSLMRLYVVDLGFDADNLVMMQAAPLGSDPGAYKDFYVQLRDRIRALPDVANAGVVDNFALGAGLSSTILQGTGAPTQVTSFLALPGYLETIGANLHEGRLLTPDDDARGLQAVVLNESAAQMLFKDGSALSREVRQSAGKQSSWTVVGIVRDIRHGGPLSHDAPQAFFSLQSSDVSVGTPMMLVARTRRPMAQFAPLLEHEANSIGPRVVIDRIRTAKDLFADHIVVYRRRAILFGTLSGVALLLAVAAVFGTTAFTMSQRVLEIGVRLALGGTPRRVTGTMMKESLVPIAIGVVLGLGGVALVARALRAFLFQTTASDPLTLAAVVAAALLSGTIAALLPSARACRTNPVETMRSV
jgi:putative ABC transport system permease protein